MNHTEFLIRFRKIGTFCSGSALVACGAATFGRDPLRNVPRLCSEGLKVECIVSISIISTGGVGSFTLARLLLELTCNHGF